jgi:peroxiredoxin
MKKAISSFLLSFIMIVAFAQQKPEGLFINSRAADFKAKDQNGNEIVLKDLRKKGPVVIVFYRGYWCPYCNKSLKRLQDSLQLLTKKNAKLIAITPEAQEGIDSTVIKTGATFPIIYDEGMKISSLYNVAFKVDERALGRYKNAGIDLLKVNNQQKEASLPVPAVYVINEDGAVTYRYFNEDYRKAPFVKEILDAVK